MKNFLIKKGNSYFESEDSPELLTKSGIYNVFGFECDNNRHEHDKYCEREIGIVINGENSLYPISEGDVITFQEMINFHKKAKKLKPHIESRLLPRNFNTWQAQAKENQGFFPAVVEFNFEQSYGKYIKPGWDKKYFDLERSRKLVEEYIKQNLKIATI